MPSAFTIIQPRSLLANKSLITWKECFRCILVYIETASQVKILQFGGQVFEVILK